VIDKAAEHRAGMSCEVVESIVRFFVNVMLVHSDGKLGTDFTTGALGDTEEVDKVGVAVPLKALGDIRHNGNGGPANLVNKSVIFSKT